MTYYSDYENEPIGGGNPYYRCVHCKLSDPSINGRLDGHDEYCKYRIRKEAEGCLDDVEPVGDALPPAQPHLVAEVETELMHIEVRKHSNGLYDVLNNGVVRHPQGDADMAIRALAHYLQSSEHAKEKLRKQMSGSAKA